MNSLLWVLTAPMFGWLTMLGLRAYRRRQRRILRAQEQHDRLVNDVLSNTIERLGIRRKPRPPPEDTAETYPLTPATDRVPHYQKQRGRKNDRTHNL